MQKDSPAFRKEVRRALSHLNDLAYLEACPLAANQGRALQRLLREAVEHIRPPGLPVEADRKWRPYWVLYYRYIQGQSRRKVMAKMAISDATFIHAQRKAIAAVCDFIRERELYPPPLSPRPLPCVERFVGREEELAAYRRRLKQEGFAAIVGPPGAGKTVLGAELAAGWQAEGQPVLWVTLREGRNVTLEALLESIALSLAARGQEDYWRFLQAERRKQAPLSPDSRVRYLLTVLEQGGYTLCLDDYQLVNENQAINALCADLLRSAGRREIWLLVMSRVTPRFIRGRLFKSLGGLGREDARRLLRASDLPVLPEAVFAELYTRTGGLPVFLRLFAAWARSRGLEDMGNEEVRQKLVSFAENMAKERDVRGYLLREVYETLNSQERRFLTCVVAFRLPFKTEDQPVIDLLKAEGVQDIEGAWMALAERYIFTSLGDQGTITLHPLVRAYFCQRLRLNPDERERLHQRVGEYYEESVGDTLEAAHHYKEAGDVYAERAARLLSENVTQLINAGQAELALDQLERLTPHLARTAGAALRFEAAAREQLCHLLGRRGKQKATLSTMRVLALSEELDDPSTGSGQAGWRLAVAHNRRARFHQATGDCAAAIAAAQAGLEAARRAGDAGRAEQARSLALWGKAQSQHGEYAPARERLDQAQARAAGERRIEAKALNSLGAVCYKVGDYATAHVYYEQALTLCRELGDRRGEAKGLNNLGLIYHDLGDFASAREYHEQSLTIEQSLGNRQGEGGSLNNLGLVSGRAGDSTATQEYHEQSLSIARVIGDQVITSYALTDLGMAREGLGELDGAEAAYREALGIRREIGQVALAGH